MYDVMSYVGTPTPASVIEMTHHPSFQVMSHGKYYFSPKIVEIGVEFEFVLTVIMGTEQ